MRFGFIEFIKRKLWKGVQVQPPEIKECTCKPLGNTSAVPGKVPFQKNAVSENPNLTSLR